MAETFNIREDQVIVSRVAWDMAQWELHYLRGLFGTLIVEDTLHARNGKRLRHEYEEACLRALRDPDYRSRAGCCEAIRASDPVVIGSNPNSQQT